MSAEKIGATGSLHISGYLDGLERTLTENMWQKTTPQGVPHGRGLMWTRRDFTSRSDTSEFSKLAVLVAPSHGYMLRLFCWAKTPGDLESAVNTVDGLKMNPDWSDRPEDAEDAVPPAPGKRVRVSSGVLAGNRTYMVNPEYPKQAHDAGIHGGVFLRVLLGTDGSVKRLYVLEGDPLLVQATIDAVHQWTYKPYLLNGEPVEIVGVLWVEFK